MIPAQALQAIAEHAASAYPAECCGLLLEDAQGGRAYRPIANIAGTPAASGTSARTGRDGYVMEPKALLAALAEAEDAGGRLWAIVHSHPDVGAYFSSEDREMALGGGSEPLWPGVAYVVVSVRRGSADGVRIYTWDPAAGDFAEGQVTGVP